MMADEDTTLELEDVVTDDDALEAVEDDIVLEGEEVEDPDEPPAMKQVRDWGRDQARRAAVAERALAEATAPKTETIIVGNKPDLWEDCEGDPDRYDSEVEAWRERQRRADAQVNAQREFEQSRETKVRDLDVTYRTSATKLGPQSAAVFEQADKEFREMFGDNATIALAGLFKEPAKIVVALHKYPKRREAILAEPDTTKRILLIKEVEMALKAPAVRRATAEPETGSIVTGSTATRPINGKDHDKVLASLEAAAEKSGGNRNAIIAYKQKHGLK